MFKGLIGCHHEEIAHDQGEDNLRLERKEWRCNVMAMTNTAPLEMNSPVTRASSSAV